MAIVPNWTDPLEESLKDLVSRSYLAGEDVSKYRDTASLLEGTPVPQHIEQHIAQLAEDRKRRAAQAAEKKARETEEAYQRALEFISMDQIAAIEQGIQELNALHGYKDADDKVNEAHTKIARLKKKQLMKKLLKVAAVLVVVLGGLIAIIISDVVSTKKTMEQIANAQALADAGQNTEALAIIEELNLQGKSGAVYPDIFTVTETVLENTAFEEGLLAACMLMNQLSNTIPYSIQLQPFGAYAIAHLASDPISVAEQTQVLFWLNDMNVRNIPDADNIIMEYMATLPLAAAASVALDAAGRSMFSSEDLPRTYMQKAAAELPAEEAWPILTRAVDMRIIKLDEDFVQPVAVAYAGTLDSEQAWEFITGMQDTLSPDHLLQAISFQLNALADEIQAGTKVDMDAWMEAHGPLLDQIRCDPDAALQLLYALNDAGYDTCALFPEGILVNIPIAARTCAMLNDLNEGIEQAGSPGISALLPVSVKEESISAKIMYEKDQSSLDEHVEDHQADEDNYEVRLLPEYLFRLPEIARPVTFSDCTTLLCMQQVYCFTSVITRTEYTKNSYGSLKYSTTYYYPAFSALDLVTLFDMADSDVYSIVSGFINSPQVDDNEWFNDNKNTQFYFEVINNSTLLGEFDTEALKEEYETAFTLFSTLYQ